MLRNSQVSLCLLVFYLVPLGTHAQNATAPLHSIHADGLKSLTEAQIQDLSGLQPGLQVGRSDLQTAADKLGHTGLFSSVNYNFQTTADGVDVTFHVQEGPRIPAYFDNFPWFADDQLNTAIHEKLPFYDGTLPSDGDVVNQASAALSQFLSAHGRSEAVEHLTVASPGEEGSIQEFHLAGPSFRIASVEFGEASLKSSRVLQQQLDTLLGKPYSRLSIDLFLTEHVRPLLLQQGYLQAKLGPPQPRLASNATPNASPQIPVFIPVTPGPVFHVRNVEWIGNAAVASADLTKLSKLKPGDVADGMALEATWESVRDEYAHRGFLDAKIEAQPAFDDATHTVTYAVHIEEGPAYRLGGISITGLSVPAEKILRISFPIPQNAVFDKRAFDQFLATLQAHPSQIFKNLPLNYDKVEHWLQTDPAKATVQVLFDFK